MDVRPTKTQISLGIRPVWSESSMSAWRNNGALATHWAHSEDFDQTGRMPRLTWVFAGRTLILLVLSGRGSFVWKNDVLPYLSERKNLMFESHYVSRRRGGDFLVWIPLASTGHILVCTSSHYLVESSRFARMHHLDLSVKVKTGLNLLN